MSELIEFLLGNQVNDTNIINQNYLFISIIYTLIVSGYMLLIYKSIHTSLSFNKKFSTTLMILSVVSCLLLSLIQNNPLLSLGVLGSLSICRIRTNTKDPRDIGFVFWALAIGISGAIHAFYIGLIGSLFLGTFLYIYENFKKDTNSLLMIIRGDKKYLDNVLNIMHGSHIQSKNIFKESYELVYELHLNHDDEKYLLNKISNLDGVSGVNILAPETKVI